jgi:hypothetical protein
MLELTWDLNDRFSALHREVHCSHAVVHVDMDEEIFLGRLGGRDDVIGAVFAQQGGTGVGAVIDTHPVKRYAILPTLEGQPHRQQIHHGVRLTVLEKWVCFNYE